MLHLPVCTMIHFRYTGFCTTASIQAWVPFFFVSCFVDQIVKKKNGRQIFRGWGSDCGDENLNISIHGQNCTVKLPKLQFSERVYFWTTIYHFGSVNTMHSATYSIFNVNPLPFIFQHWSQPSPLSPLPILSQFFDSSKSRSDLLRIEEGFFLFLISKARRRTKQVKNGMSISKWSV